jgi:hypothetical protein
MRNAVSSSTWGLAAAVGSFFAKEYQRPPLKVRPTTVGYGGYGLGAVGSFW